MLNSTKQSVKSPLYVAGKSYGFEQMVQHCLWKLLSETGFIHLDQLTQMETVVLSELLKTKYDSSQRSLLHDSQHEVDLLNKAIDKIVCQVRVLQLQNQKYQSVIIENTRLRNGLNRLIKNSEPPVTSSFPLKLERLISEIGLSKRTVRILQAVGIDTLGKLRSCSLPGLRDQNRVGVKTIHEIENVLAQYSIQDSSER